MSAMIQAVQAVLPLDLYDQLSILRQRYRKALGAAATGDYSKRVQLRALSRYLGHLLAAEARKSVEERGGVRMLELSLTVDRHFPELRGWNQEEVRLRQQRCMRNQLQAVQTTSQRAG